MNSTEKGIVSDDVVLGKDGWEEVKFHCYLEP